MDPSTTDLTFENGNPLMPGNTEMVAIDAQSENYASFLTFLKL